MSVDNSLDVILNQVGDFGIYQIYVFGLVCLAVVFHSAVHVAYVFTAMDLDYRCAVPGCDHSETEYEPKWLPNAVPYTRNKPSSCTRYVSKNITQFHNCTEPNEFLPTTEICSSFIYKTDEHTILNEYNLQCDDNLWKLTLVGTINTVGQFIGLFVSGFLSDRYGRKTVLIVGLSLSGVFGMIRTFAPSYIWFLVFELLDATFGAGSYICGFVIGVELVGPNRRVLTGTLASSCYAVGEVFASATAWLVQSWRLIIYILYTPAILTFFYFWMIPESIRWNLSRGNITEAKKTLRKLAKVNGKAIPEHLLDNLSHIEEKQPKVSYLEVLKSTPLLLRLINCCLCWITCAFLFYGLTLNSVALAGNSYLDFMLTAIVEIPAYIACASLIDRFGRKLCLSVAFFITGFACLGFLFIPEEAEHERLAVYLLGKFGATASFTTAYVLTSELFPTSLRHTMMGTCSTFARLGSIIAPQTPLLIQLWEPLPIVMFTTMATIAGLLTLLFPETLGTKLPDTIEEAVNIGKEQSNNVKTLES